MAPPRPAPLLPPRPPWAVLAVEGLSRTVRLPPALNTAPPRAHAREAGRRAGGGVGGRGRALGRGGPFVTPPPPPPPRPPPRRCCRRVPGRYSRSGSPG